MSQFEEVMSSFDIGAIVRELSPYLVNRLVDNIYQLNSHTLLISFQGLQEKLILEAGRRLHLTSYKYDIPRTPPSFCRALRKYLRRARLQRVAQVDFDRIVMFVFSSRAGEFRLYTEFFGKGNHILVDNEQRILQALTYRRMKDRDVIRGEILLLPPSRRKNILEATRLDVKDLLNRDGPLTQQLINIFNIGTLYANEIIKRAGLDGGRLCKTLSLTEIDIIYDAIQSLLTSYKKMQPHIILDKDGAQLNVLSFPLKIYEELEMIFFQSFNRAIDEYYVKLLTRKVFTQVISRSNKQLEENRRILGEQIAQKVKLEENARINQEIGDIIYINSHKLQEIINWAIKKRRSGKPWTQILNELDDNVYSSILVSINPDNATANIRLKEVNFNIDLRKNIYDNASIYYKRAKVAKAKLKGLQKAFEETQRKIDMLLNEEKNQTVKAEAKPIKVRKRAWYEKFHWFHSSIGNLVLGGRDATTNDILIKRYTDSTDIILHADILGSPFAIIQSKGNDISDTTIFEAAQMVASYSRAWRSGFSAIDVYWIKPDQVSKKPPSGEYLRRGSFMIYGLKNYIRNIPLKLAIGVKETSDGLLVIGGPVSAIASQTKIFVEIVPGSIKTGKLVKSIAFKLIDKAPEALKSEIKQIPLWEFQVFIPSGGGKISKD